MKNKELILFPAVFLVLSGTIILHRQLKPTRTGFTVNAAPDEIGCPENIQNRAEWEFERLKDPVTNSIPADIRRKELEFAKKLPYFNSTLKNNTWVARGPYNVGGRTRGAAIDVTNENIIIAGGVSGGLWRTVDGGNSWQKVIKPFQLHNVTCLVQDTRPGKTNIWYYGTGEVDGNSANESFSAPFRGDGIFKSTDNGLNWDSLPSTYSGTPYHTDPWDFIWNISLDYSNDSTDIVYVALSKSIRKSMDGGLTWSNIIPFTNNGPIYTDVAVTSTGVVYIAMSIGGFNNQNKGIRRSSDGINYVNITPSGLGSAYNRIIITVNPLNENEVYFFANTPGAGQHSYTFFGYQEWNSLFKYTYISGDGTGAGCQWENLSQNLPAGSPYRFDNIYVQGSYDMVIKFKPDEPNILFLGGTNLYRSADAFTTPDNIKQIGGYKPGSIDSNWDLYPNHHPDQHVLMFMPSNSDIMISANDGGVYKTYNCMADSVEWSKLNRGYLTSQLYTVIIDETTTNDIIIGGFQDNGNFFTNSADPAASWVMPLNGDGAFGNIANQGQTYYLSIQNGKTYKMQLDDEGHSLAFARIDPIGGDNYEFINPFVVDPNNNNIMYLPCYRTIFRNDSLNYIPLTGNKDSISTGWFRFSFEPQSYVTAISVSTILANRVYCASSGKVYRIDSADVNDPSIHPISPLPDLGYISCIAIDPRDADKVAAVISSYRTYSMFYSVNGGATWCHVAGNLEEEPDGDGNGPSFRWLEIMPFGNQTLYLLATSVGIFATDTLYLDVDSADWSIDSTMWVNVGQNIIGNVVTEMIVSRPTDNLVVVGTHGNGIFSIKLSDINALLGNKKYNRKTTDEISLYPNPAAGFIYLAFELINSSKVEIFIYDRTGKLIEMPETKTCFPGHNNIKLRTGDYPAGTYFIKVKTGSNCYSKAFVVIN